MKEKVVQNFRRDNVDVILVTTSLREVKKKRTTGGNQVLSDTRRYDTAAKCWSFESKSNETCEATKQ